MGTDLHYYAYLDTATRRLNAPGASRLVDDASFGEMVDNIDSCIQFMDSHVRWPGRDSTLLADKIRIRIGSATRISLGTARCSPRPCTCSTTASRLV